MHITSLAAALALATSAAQAVAAEANDGAAAAGATELDRIVVYGHSGQTSTMSAGLPLTLRQTPQSVSIVTREQIDDQAMTRVTDALNFATGISVKAADRGRNELSARGFPITNFQIDGVPMVTGNIGLEESRTPQYARIEVVRGATGLLNGAGEPSATINLVRKRADSTVFTGTLDLEAGSWGRRSGTVDLSMPLRADGALRARVVADGYRQRSFIDLEKTRGHLFYAVLDADLGERTRLSLGASRQRDERAGVLWAQLPYWYADGVRTDWPRSKTSATRWNQWDTGEQAAFLNLAHDLAGGWQLRADLNHHRRNEDSKLLWLVGIPERTSGAGIQAEPYWYRSRPNLRSVSLTANGPFSLFGRQHELALGALHSRFEDGWSNRPADSFGAAAGDFNHWDGNFPEPSWGERYLLCCIGVTRQSALYAAARLNPSDALKLILGGRISDWRRSEDVSDANPAVYATRHRNIFTPYAGLIYALNEHVSAYASYTSIFNPQDARDIEGRFLDPTEGDSYEVGLKADILRDRLRTAVAVFRTEQSNLASRVDISPLTGLEYHRAIDGAVIEGYELELAGRPTPNWDLSLGWAAFSARAVDGAEVEAHHPRRTLNLASRYDFTDGVLAGLSIGGAMKWESRPPKTGINPGSGQSELIGQPAHALFSLMARYRFNRQLSLQLNIDNLTDKTYYTQNSLFDGYLYGEPRNTRLTLRYAF